MKTALNVALLRGINVGTAKRVRMADLRALVEELGYGGPRTLLNSGNIVFKSSARAGDDPARRIEKGIASRFGFTSRVTVLAASELAEIVAGNPLLKVAIDPSRLLLAILSQTSDRKLLDPILKRDWRPGALATGPRVAYLWCPEGSIKSPLAQAAFRALGTAQTTRNWATILKLHAMCAEDL